MTKVTPHFAKLHQQVVARFFSRDPKLWPLLGSPTAQSLIEQSRRNASHRGFPIETYPRGDELYQRLNSVDRFPQKMAENGEASLEMSRFVASFGPNIYSPHWNMNLLGAPSDPSLAGAVMALLADPNLVHKEYCGLFEDAERAVMRQLATLVGYDPSRATGIFTSGGTMANIYGYLLGIRKTFPDSGRTGLDPSVDYRVFSSLAGHYSNTTGLSVLGMNVDDRYIRIPIGSNNAMDLKALERELEQCIRLKIRIVAILATCGSTDTFGVDDIAGIHAIRERLCDKYNLRVKPHIHADAAVGWSMCFFNDYDTGRNPLGLNEPATKFIRQHQQHFRALKFADSATIDFHKWGWVPYPSSVILIKEKEDFQRLAHDPSNFTYFQQKDEGRNENHFHTTIECSRNGVGALAAMAGLEGLGVEGMQIMIAHSLQNAHYFRTRLSQLPRTAVIASHNYGPNVAFRLYPPHVTSIRDELKFERTGLAKKHDPFLRSTYDMYYKMLVDGQDLPSATSKSINDAYLRRTANNSAYHRRIFDTVQRCCYTDKGLWTNFIASATHSNFDELAFCHELSGEKAVFFNPYTTDVHIDQHIELLREHHLQDAERATHVFVSGAPSAAKVAIN